VAVVVVVARAELGFVPVPGRLSRPEVVLALVVLDSE